MVLGGGTIATYVLNYMTTFAETSLHLGARVAFLATMLPNLLAIPAALLGGLLSDRIGRRPVMIWGQTAFVLAILPVFFLMVREPTGVGLVAGGCLLAIINVFGFNAFYVAFSESLPKFMRGRAVGAVYACAIAAFGGSTQAVIAWLIHATGRPEAPGVYMFVGALSSLTGMWLMLESAPVRQAALAPTPA